jgi:hypothetical protein
MSRDSDLPSTRLLRQWPAPFARRDASRCGSAPAHHENNRSGVRVAPPLCLPTISYERRVVCIAKNCSTTKPADRRTTPVDAPARRSRRHAARPHFMSGNPRLTEGKSSINRGKIEPKSFLQTPLKLIPAFLIRFLPLVAVPGASSWVRNSRRCRCVLRIWDRSLL